MKAEKKPVAFDSLAELHRALVGGLLTDGKSRAPRGKATLEEQNVTFALNVSHEVVTDAGRRFDEKYAAGELLWHLRGSKDLEEIAHYAKFWRNASDDGVTLNSTYGYFFRLYQRTLLELLLSDKVTRKAHLPLYFGDNVRNSKDNPCCVGAQFFFDEEETKLNLTIFQRSQDVWYGLPYDLLFWQVILCRMVYLLTVYPGLEHIRSGEIIQHTTSLHIYQRHFSLAEELVEKPLLVARYIPVTGRDFIDLKRVQKTEEILRETGQLPLYPNWLEENGNSLAPTLHQWLTSPKDRWNA